MSETSNSINLLVKLGVDTAPSQQNLQTQINELSKKLEANISINFGEDTKRSLKVAGSDLAKISKVAKDTSLGIVEMAEKFRQMGSGTSKPTEQIKKNFKDIEGTLSTVFKDFSKESQKVLKQGVVDAEELKKAFVGLSPTFKEVTDVVTNKVGEQQKVLKGLEITYTNLATKARETLAFNNNSLIVMPDGSERNLWLPDTKDISSVNSSIKQVEQNIASTHKKLVELRSSGKLNTQQFNELATASQKMSDPNSINLFNQRLNETLEKNKRLTKEKQEQIALEEKIRKLQNTIITAQKRDPKGIGSNSEVTGMLDSLKGINPASDGALDGVNKISNGFSRLKAEATVAGRESIGVVQSLKVALEKFPLWMVASTAFYGTIRTAREFSRVIIDIDTKLTSLRKVMDIGTDFEALFERATQSAERFGKSISETMDSYIEFARQGYTDNELGFLADAAVVASNVGDITAQAASDLMTASLIQWKKDANEAMGVIDSWNEISNSYATTVEKLAEGQARAGSTARAMGLEYDQVNAIIGTVTASTKQSGKEVGNFLKAVLPRLTSQPGQKALDSLGVSLTDKDGNLRDIIQVYTEVAERVQGIADSERIAVVEGLAGKYHISRMQALLDDLGSAESMYRDMYETSVNSAGSAIAENEQYMKSLEARMALARVEVEKLALSIGEAFLTEGMVQGIKVFGDALGVIAKLTDSVGALPVLFAVVGASAFGLSNRFRTLVTAIATGTTSMSANKAASIGMTVGMTGASVATKTLTNSLRGLLAASGVGIVLAGIGVALEFVISKIGETRQKSEDLASHNRLLAESYEQNKESIDSLANSYKDLSNKDAIGALEEGSAEHAKYLSIQNELATLLPELVVGEDAKGNAILANSDIVSGHIELLKERLEIERQLKREEQIDDSKDRFSTAKTQAEDAQKQLEGIMDNIDTAIKSVNQRYSSQLVFSNDFGLKPEEIKSYQDVVDKLTEINQKKKDIKDSDADYDSNPMYQYYDSLSTALGNYAQSYSDAYHEQSKGNKTLELETRNLVNTYISGSEEMSVASKNFAIEILNAGIAGETSSKKLEDFQSVAENLNLGGSIDKDIAVLGEAFDKLTATTGEDVEQLKAKFDDAFKSIKDSFLNQSNLDVGSSEYIALSEALDKARDSKLKLYDASAEYAKQNNVTIEQAIIHLKQLEDTAEIEDLLGTKRYELADTTEQLSGVSNSLIEDNEQLIIQHELMTQQLQMLTEGSEEYNAVKMQLEGINQRLLALNPSLFADSVTATNLGKQQIEILKQENHARDILKASVKALLDGKLEAEEESTLAALMNTNARIDIINSEILANQRLVDAYASVYDDVKRAAEAGDESAARALMRISVPIGKAQMLQAEHAKLTIERTGYTNTLAQSEAVLANTTTNSNKALAEQIKNSKSATKAQKDAAKEMERSIFIADKYKRALEELNLKIKEQQDIQSQFPDYTDKHQKALQAELKLQQDKMNLLKDQEKNLQAQIKAGNILKTGVVTTKSGGGGTQKLSGWGGSINSQYGMRKHPIYGDMRMHDGIDIGGKQGTRLDANVSGKVVFAGNKGNGLGNYVTIQSEDGLKHIYAHLDKVVAKLGDTITAGMQVGTIGKTGSATGSHLHYQVNDKSGKSINPASYVDSARKGISEASKEVAQVQADIEGARSELISLQGQMVDQSAGIRELEAKLLNATFSGYDRQRVKNQQIIDYEIAKLKEVDVASDRYGKTLDKVGSHLKAKQRVNQEELVALEKLIRTGGLTGDTLEKMKDRVWALKTEMFSLNEEIRNIDLDRLNALMGEHEDVIDGIVYEYQRAEAIMALYEEGTADYNEQLANVIEGQKQHRDAVKAQISALQQELLTMNLGSEEIKNREKQIRDLTLQYWNLSSSVINSEKSLEASRKKMAEEAADAMVNAYKSYLNEKRDMHLRSIDNELQAEDSRHKKVMDNYKKELDAFRKIVQEKLDAIDKEESERSYAKDIDKLEEEKNKIQSKLNLLSLDDSLEAKAERKKLSEELSKIEEDLFEKRNAKEVSDRKENLNSMLKDKEEQIQKEEQLADEQHNAAKDRIDKEKRYWDQFYTDQLNDERKFAKMKEDIVAGNFDNMSKEFQAYIKEMEDTMPELVDTLDGTMQAVGTSIRQNLIDNLREALDMLAKVDANNIATANPSPGGMGSAGIPAGGSHGSAQSKQTLSSADLQVLTGKYYNDRLASQTQNPVTRGKVKEKAYELANSGRSSGSSISSNEGFDSIIAGLSQTDKEALGKHLMGAGSQHVSTPALQDIIKKYGKQLMNSAAKLNTGGYIPKGKEGFTYLHEEEVVLNKPETKRFFDLVPVLEKLNTLLSPLTMPKVKAPDLSTSTGDSYYFDFHVDKMTGSEKDADNFMKQINDRLKRNKGMR